MQMDVMEDGIVDQELFSLSNIKAKNDLAAVDSLIQSGDENYSSGEDGADSEARDTDDESANIDLDEDRKRYDEKLEAVLDEAYEWYIVAKEGCTRLRNWAKLASSSEGGLWKDTEEVEDGDDNNSDNSNEEGVMEPNPLVVLLTNAEEPSKEELIKQWFSQDVFAGFEDPSKKYDSDSDHSVDEKVASPKNVLPKSNKSKQKTEQILASTPSNISKGNSPSSVKDDDFEVVPDNLLVQVTQVPLEDESDYDTNTKAEILAYAKKMLRKEQWEEILDAAYNRYTFNDDNLPIWFAEDGEKHNRRQKPITTEEIEAMKAQFIDAWPAKKVAQAKARKKRVAMKKLEAGKNKANAIANQIDISNFSKSKMIEKLYKKATPKKPQKEYVVAKRGVLVKGGKGKVVVDKRMKKDKQTSSSGKPRKGSKKGNGASGKNGKVFKKHSVMVLPQDGIAPGGFGNRQRCVAIEWQQKIFIG